MSRAPYYVSKREVDAQYRPKGYGLSPGLLRARAPYRLRNALTGLVVGAFAVGVWAYSIKAVKQDSFEDVDEEAKALVASRASSASDRSTAVLTPAGASPSNNSAHAPVAEPDHPILATPQSTVGVLARALEARFPQVLDPRSRTLIWGAPPVDKLGKLGDRPADDSES